MRRLTAATILALILAGPTLAQDVLFPSITLPEPGTFCGPLQLCEPFATRDAQR